MRKQAPTAPTASTAWTSEYNLRLAFVANVLYRKLPVKHDAYINNKHGDRPTRHGAEHAINNFWAAFVRVINGEQRWLQLQSAACCSSAMLELFWTGMSRVLEKSSSFVNQDTLISVPLLASSSLFKAARHKLAGLCVLPLWLFYVRHGGYVMPFGC